MNEPVHYDFLFVCMLCLGAFLYPRGERWPVWLLWGALMLVLVVAAFASSRGMP